MRWWLRTGGHAGVAVDRRASDADLDAIALEGTDSAGADALATRPRAPRNDASGSLPRWVLVVAGIGALALVVSTVAAFHFQRKTRGLSRELSLAERTLPNRGQLAYGGGELLALPAPAGISATAAVSFANVTDPALTWVWVLVRVDGLDPDTEFDLETQSCDGAVGLSLDKGAAHRDGSSFFETARLVLPRRGRSYNVVVRRYRGDPVVGFTLRWDKRVVALPVGTRGC